MLFFSLEQNESADRITQTKRGEREMPNIKSTPTVDRNTSLLQHYKTSLTSFGEARVRDGKTLREDTVDYCNDDHC